MVSPQFSSQDDRLPKDADVYFELLMDGHDGQHVVPVVLQCQCQHLGLSMHDEPSQDAQSDMGALDAAIRSVVFILRDDAHAEHENLQLMHRFSSSSSQPLPVQLNLQYQDSSIDAEGCLASLDSHPLDETHSVLFTFAEPDSMKARMMLQLIKICQMKSDLDSHSIGESCDIAQAAKRWTDCFAENFAKNFDAQHDQNL